MNRIFLTVVLIALSTHASAASHKSAALQQAEREAAQKSRVAQPEHVGDLVYFVSEPHATEYKRSGATYVAIHFASMKLGPNDSLTVHTPDGKRSAEYAHVGQQPFWATSMPGGTALITLNNSSGTASYTVDLYYAGRSGNALATTNQGSFALQQVCGDDDSKEARCYAAETAYAKSKAVARLLINGGEACTGWLIGSEGHLLTNEHCVHGVNDSVQVEMMAEGDDCSTDCNQPFACPGVVVASAERNPATFVAASVKYDYALLKLDRSVPAKYGFLQARKTGPRQNEIVYIPQHPRAAGKRLLVASSDPADRPSGVAHINSVNASACNGGTASEVGYQADTDPGASGSPVISGVDHLVVALHHCGGCPNRGIPIDHVITSLGKKLPKSAVK